MSETLEQFIKRHDVKHEFDITIEKCWGYDSSKEQVLLINGYDKNKGLYEAWMQYKKK